MESVNRNNWTCNRLARGTERYASKQAAKLGFAIGDKVKVLGGDRAGEYGKVIECQPYGSYLVVMAGGMVVRVEGKNLEMC